MAPSFKDEPSSCPLFLLKVKGSFHYNSPKIFVDRGKSKYMFFCTHYYKIELFRLLCKTLPVYLLYFSQVSFLEYRGMVGDAFLSKVKFNFLVN